MQVKDYINHLNEDIMTPPPLKKNSPRFEPASFFRRSVATFFDLSLMGFFTLSLFSLAIVLGMNLIIANVIIGIGASTYFLLGQSSSWQGTVGKKLMGLKIIGGEDKPLPFFKSIIRFLVQFNMVVASKHPIALLASLGFFVIDHLWALISKSNKTIHDMVVGSSVIDYHERSMLSVIGIIVLSIVILGSGMALHDSTDFWTTYQNLALKTDKRIKKKEDKKKNENEWLQYKFADQKATIFVPANWLRASQSEMGYYARMSRSTKKKKLELAFKAPSKLMGYADFIAIQKITEKKSKIRKSFFKKHLKTSFESESDLLDKLKKGTSYRKGRKRVKLDYLYDESTNIWWKLQGNSSNRLLSAWVETNEGKVQVSVGVQSHYLSTFFPEFIKIVESIEISPSYEVNSGELYK